jgi:hypothetical protein
MAFISEINYVSDLALTSGGVEFTKTSDLNFADYQTNMPSYLTVSLASTARFAFPVNLKREI